MPQVNLTVQRATAKVRKMIACEARFARPHKASFDAVSRISASRIIDNPIDCAGLAGREFPALSPVQQLARRPCWRTSRQSGHRFAIARGCAPLVRALPTKNRVGSALPRTAGVPLNFVLYAGPIESVLDIL